jgi:hypothetical protein
MLLVSRKLVAASLVIGLLACLTAPAAAQQDHLDPPGPPKWEEFVYLHSLRLLEDLDDGFLFFDGDTELLVRVQIAHPGHAGGEAVFAIEDIDMDPPYETLYHVLDGTLTEPERKGGKVRVYHHLECDPLPGVDFTITAWELDASNVGKVIQKLGEAATRSVAIPGMQGVAAYGPAAVALGAAIDLATNGITAIGSNSGLIGAGVSGWVQPTTKYEYKTEYVANVVDNFLCESSTSWFEWLFRLDSSDVGDGGSYHRDLELYPDLLSGFDEQHPFTKNRLGATFAGLSLQEALAAVDDIALEPGAETTPDVAAIQAALRDVTAEIPREALVEEINEGTLGGVDPGALLSAAVLLSSGDAHLAAFDHDLAIDDFITGIEVLLPLNHPEHKVWANLGRATEGGFGSGAPVLYGQGDLTASSPFTLSLANAAPSSIAWLVIGLPTGLHLLNAPFKGGTLVPAPDLFVLLPTFPDGHTPDLLTTWPGGLPAGLVLYFQYWVVDPSVPVTGLSASNALAATTP